MGSGGSRGRGLLAARQPPSRLGLLTGGQERPPQPCPHGLDPDLQPGPRLSRGALRLGQLL